METQTELKKRILDEMTIKHSSILSENFDLAKRYVRVRDDGSVDLLVRERVTGKEQILLYLIGKIYAKEAALTNDENVGNAELLDQLGIPEGSLFPWLKELRETNQVRQLKRENNVFHAVPPPKIGEILLAIEKKLA